MYLEHFGLNEPPFRITPHTDFFFDGANRGATLDALIYAITHDEGIVKVSGEVGSGKTMLCRVLMERLPDTVTIVYLANPSLSRDDILYAIADELRLDIPENSRTSMVMRALQDSLIQSYGEGRQVVVLIDEAHAMPAETLEEIRLLSNLESNRSKLLQLVLFGQPELNDILARPDMRQLKERITHNFGLEPLVRDDIANYLDFRMRAAGYRGPSVFSLPALKLIAQSSLGLTRRINIIADKSLLAAFSDGSHQIGAKEAQAAIKDCEFSDATYRGKGSNKKRLLWLAVAILAAILLTLFAAGLPQHENPPLPLPPSIPAAGEKPLATLPTPAPLPAQSAVEPSTGSTPAAPAGTSPPSSNPLARGAPAPAAPAPSVAVSPAPTSAAPAAPATSDAEKSQPANVGAPSTDARPYPRKAGRLTRERIESSRAWLEQLPNDRWFIQIFAADAERHGEVESLLRRLAAGGEDSEQLRVYYSELSGRPRYGVIYGDYPSREKAATAIRSLSAQLRANKPYPRPAVRLR
ncbi:MAG: AAA family ATPase [Rhodocyclales bacterium]|nr:AAA family ATPase [Rhodocyclales bacterium]